MVKFVLFVATLIIPTTTLLAQTPSKAGDTTWDLAGGLAAQRTSNGTFDYGWNASIAERPYVTHPWVGGVIESSGVYHPLPAAVPGFTVTERINLFTAMAGPLVVYPSRHARPFAHAIIGGVVSKLTTVGSPAGSYSQTDAYFGHMLGGGLDLSIRKRMSVRTQADWLRVWKTDFSGFNRLHLSGGLVYSF